MSEAIRLTPVQKDTLIRMGKARYSDMHFDGRTRFTAWALMAKGLIGEGNGNWFSLTLKGQAYLDKLGIKHEQL